MELSGFDWELRKKIKFSLKILAENMHAPDLKNSIRKNDTLPFEETLTKVLQKADLFASYQKNDILEEDENFEEILETNKTINFWIMVQIGILIVLSIINILRFKSVFSLLNNMGDC